MGLGLVGKLTVMFGADMKGFNRSMKNAEKSLNKTARNFKRIGSSLTTNVTLPVLGLGAASVKLASDLEESVNKVRVSFGDSSKEVDLKDINSVEDVASNMKEVIKEQKVMESEDSEGNAISVDVSKTIEANKELLKHPFYNL